MLFRSVEVVPLLELKAIPHAPRGVAGLFNYRGQPVPAVDLCALTSGRPARELFSTRIIVVNLPAAGDEWRVAGGAAGDLPAPSSPVTRHPPPRQLGLIVEHATGLMRREVRDFVPSGVQPGHAPYLGPVVMDDQGVIQLLHTEHLLPETVRALLFSDAPTRDDGASARSRATHEVV